MISVRVARMSGRVCRNTVWHAVRGGGRYDRSICGKRPKMTAAGWSVGGSPGVVTCPYCLAGAKERGIKLPQPEATKKGA